MRSGGVSFGTYWLTSSVGLGSLQHLLASHWGLDPSVGIWSPMGSCTPVPPSSLGLGPLGPGPHWVRVRGLLSASMLVWESILSLVCIIRPLLTRTCSVKVVMLPVMVEPTWQLHLFGPGWAGSLWCSRYPVRSGFDWFQVSCSSGVVPWGLVGSSLWWFRVFR